MLVIEASVGPPQVRSTSAPTVWMSAAERRERSSGSVLTVTLYSCDFNTNSSRNFRAQHFRTEEGRESGPGR